MPHGETAGDWGQSVAAVGMAEVVNMVGGYRDWVAAGLPVTTNSEG